MNTPSVEKLAAKPLIMCIEDEPVYLYLRTKVLEKDGYTVVGMTNAKDALARFRDLPVCCVIADHMLRGNTGADLAQEMKRIKPDVPIVMFSGSTPDHMRGVDIFLHKGQPTHIFLAVVRDVVRRYCA